MYLIYFDFKYKNKLLSNKMKFLYICNVPYTSTVIRGENIYYITNISNIFRHFGHFDEYIINVHPNKLASLIPRLNRQIAATILISGCHNKRRLVNDLNLHKNLHLKAYFLD